MNIYYFAAFALRLKQVTKRVVLWVTFCLHNFGPVVPLEKRVACSCSDCNFCPNGFFNFTHYWSRTLSDDSPSICRARKGSLTGLSMKAMLINLTKWPTEGSLCACFWPKRLHEGGTRASLPAEELLDWHLPESTRAANGFLFFSFFIYNFFFPSNGHRSLFKSFKQHGWI